jgi:stage II sporulation protein D
VSCFRRLVPVAAAAAVIGAMPQAALGTALFLVTGSGWGNGVGMSQWGAEGYALHGLGYKAILAHYYPHTTLAAAPDRMVRVLLATAQQRVIVGSSAPFLLIDARGRRVHLAAGSLVVTPHLHVGRRSLQAPLRLEAGAQPLTLDGKGYRGTFTLLRSGASLTVVNSVPLERYLRSVVPVEMPAQWNMQAYEAQAVAARSYALAALEPGQPFDLYSDNRSQLYGGIAAETPATNEAVAATAGQVLTYDGQTITAYYDSNSGGRTAPVQDVFLGHPPEPYLVSVADPYASLAPGHSWSVARTDEQLSNRFGIAVDDVRVTHAGPGIATGVTLVGPSGDRTLTAMEFVEALSLRSLDFTVSVLSLARPPRPALAGATVVLRGFLRGVSGVILQRRLPDGAWRRVRAVAVSDGGNFLERVRPTTDTAYRLAVDGIPAPAVAVLVRHPTARAPSVRESR